VIAHKRRTNQEVPRRLLAGRTGILSEDSKLQQRKRPKYGGEQAPKLGPDHV